MEKEAKMRKAQSKEQCKTRVLAVAKMLNEGRNVTTAEILRRLELQYGITAERKTIYNDISVIDKVMPIDIIPGRTGGYKKCDLQNGQDDENGFMEGTMENKNQSPCLTCTKVKDPSDCENKSCKAWREWWLKRWEALRNGR